MWHRRPRLCLAALSRELGWKQAGLAVVISLGLALVLGVLVRMLSAVIF